ncbi:MAG: mannonate dehydratase [Chloroflexota bacterium]
MKLGVSHQKPDQLTEHHLAHLKRMGVETVEVRTTVDRCSYDDIVQIQEAVDKAGLHLHEIMLNDKYSCPEITLGLPERDATIERMQRFIENLGRAGVKHTTYAWHTGGAYETHRDMTRGCPTRRFELETALAMPNKYERTYSDDDMWETFAYFIEQVLPVAEAADVRLQLHPNDPPVTHRGVARIFRSTDAYRRGMDICGNSPHAGILFCVGSWAEMFGPDGEGEDIPAAIREFGEKKLIHQVHFRNIDRNMPNFNETFPDNGYIDMVEIFQALQDIGFDGMVVPDHVPYTPDGLSGEAFILGYIRALIQVFSLHRKA